MAAQPAAREYDVKAALLFNFCHFVEWPPHAFAADSNAPFVIGILGTDPFGPFLAELVKSERAHNRPIEVRRFATIEEAAGTHLLFIGQAEQARLNSILTSLKNKPTLTVGEAADRSFVRQGGMIAFVTDRGNVKLRINPEAARSAGLVINSKLLRLAEIVSTENR
jgi:hypothetical protein